MTDTDTLRIIPIATYRDNPTLYNPNLEVYRTEGMFKPSQAQKLAEAYAKDSRSQYQKLKGQNLGAEDPRNPAPNSTAYIPPALAPPSTRYYKSPAVEVGRERREDLKLEHYVFDNRFYRL